MQLDTLIDGLPIRAIGDASAIRVSDLTEDSRTVLPGSLFVARRGYTVDGRQFVGEAVAGGAHAVLTDDPALRSPRDCTVLLVTDDLQNATAQLAERFYGNPSSRLLVIGVTGTNGKSTTAYDIHHVLNSCGVPCGMLGTVCVDDGVEIAPAELTTPPAIELSRSLAVMLEAGRKAVVLEVSSHALAQRRVAGLSFDAAIFTSFSGDHLDYHRTMDAYADAKAGLFRSLGAEACAVVNIGAAESARMIEAAAPAGVIRCAAGHDAQPDASVTELGSSLAGTDLELRLGTDTGRVRIPRIGRFNAMNALQAVSTATRVAGVTFANACDAIAGAHGPPGRLERITPDSAAFAVFVDYAHTDDAIANAIDAVRPFVADQGRLTVVFGCGGDRDRTKRPRMAHAASAGADRVIVTSDNPRTEDPSQIISDVLAGIASGTDVESDTDRAQAIDRAVSGASAGDVVLIAGKGHETYQITPDGKGGTVTRQFDDREIAGVTLRRRNIQARDPAGLIARAGIKVRAETLFATEADAT